MRKGLVIAGCAEEGLALLPLLDANPDVKVVALLHSDRDVILAALRKIGPGMEERFAECIQNDCGPILRMPGLVAIVDAEPPSPIREMLQEAPDQGIKVIPPLIAKLLYAFGPVDATRKPDLLQALGEILESYNLTIDRRALLNRVLQIAIGATGADRGSLMLLDPTDGCLAVDVSVGIEKELIAKIRIRPGEGIAGRALEQRCAILLRGKADREKYQIFRERDDVESAISVPLIHEGHALGVLNLSHLRAERAFTEEDLEFAEQLAHIDARIISRAEEYHALRRDSAQLRAQTEIRKILALPEPLQRRLGKVCERIARELDGGVCHMYLHDRELEVLHLQASSTRLDPLASPIQIGLGEGVHGWVARSREPLLFSHRAGQTQIFYTVLPLLSRGELVGVLSLEGTQAAEAEGSIAETIQPLAQALSEELQGTLRDLRMERETTQTVAVSEFTTRIRGSSQPSQLHRLITTSAAMILEAEHSVLCLQDPGSGRFRVRSYFGAADADAQAELFALEKALSIEAIKQGSQLCIADLSKRTDLAPETVQVWNALIQPLHRGDHIIGTLSVLGKVVQNPLEGRSFDRVDQTTFSHLAEHALQALERLDERGHAKPAEQFDEITGLPNAEQLRTRLEQEMARCGGQGHKLAVLHVRIEGLGRVLDQQEEAEGDRLAISIAQELRAGLRDFDVIGRVAPDTFEILVPEPDAEVSALLDSLARRASGAITREPDLSLGETLRVLLGCAIFPDEARTSEALLKQAQQPRVTRD